MTLKQYEKVASLKVNNPYSFYDLEFHEQQALLLWCRQLEKTKTVNKKHTSYSLKHLFEKDGFYISNGSFKGAMVIAGFEVEDDREINWKFNVSEKSIKALLGT